MSSSPASTTANQVPTPSRSLSPTLSRPRQLVKTASESACQEKHHRRSRFRDANFEGASADGFKVIFLSTQQLTDDATEDPDPEDSASIGAGGKGCRSEVKGANGCNLYESEC